MYNISAIFGNNKLIPRFSKKFVGFHSGFKKVSSDNLESLYLNIPLTNSKYIKYLYNNEFYIVIVTNSLNFTEKVPQKIFNQIIIDYKNGSKDVGCHNSLGSHLIFIHDILENKLVIVNDYFGSIPLYYYNSENHLIVGTDFCLIASLLEDFKFDQCGIFQFSCSEYCLGDRTFIEDVNILKPSTILSFSSGNVILNKYNYLNITHEKQNFDTLTSYKMLDNLFTNYFKNAIPQNCKISITLTGGLDSRLLAGYLKSLNYNITSFYIGEYGYWDQTFGEDVANKLNISYNVYTTDNEHQNNILESFLNYSSPELSFRHTHFLDSIKQITNNHDIILGGVFGGEIFGQKNINRDFNNKIHYLSYLKKFFYKKSGVFDKRDDYFLKNFQNDLLLTDLELDDNVNNAGTTTTLVQQFDKFIFNDYLNRFILNGSPVLFAGNCYYLTPFLDKDIVEFAYSLPTSLRCEQKFYRGFIDWKFPQLSKIPWQFTGFPISKYGVCKYEPDKRGQFRNYNQVFKRNYNVFKNLINIETKNYGLFEIINKNYIIDLLKKSTEIDNFKDSGILSIATTLCLVIERIEKYKNASK
jgi:asparagine synthetase B (glutamine-hydrolysing)